MQGRHICKDGETCEAVTITGRSSPARAVPIFGCEGSASPLHPINEVRMRETLYIAGAIWLPILLVLVIVLVCIPLYIVGMTLKYTGHAFIYAGGWVQAKLEEWIGEWL